MNWKTNQEIIPPRFERGMPFSEGLAAVSVGGRFGYVDERGEIVIGPKFDLAGEFVHGLAEVLVGDKVGVIDRRGAFVIAPKFRRAMPLTGEVVIAVEGSGSGYPGLGIIPHEQANSGLYHISGYWVRKPEPIRISLFDKAGRGLIWATERNGRLYGLLASNGEWAVEPQYESVGQLYDERAMVRKRVDGVELSGFVDPTGQIVGTLRPLDVPNGQRRDYRAGNDNGKVLDTCPNGVRAILIDRKVQIVDVGGQPTTPYLFDPTGRPTCIDPFPVSLDGIWSFVGVDGHLLFDPPAFKDQLGFKDGYAAVSDGQKWGVIDTSGRFVLPMTLERYIGRRDGLFQVVIAGREVWLTATGEERPEPPVAPTARSGLECGHGLRLVERDGLWGISDDDGTLTIQPRYRALDCFRDGIAWAAIDSKRQWCALGPDGLVRDKPVCKTQHYLIRWTHSYPETFDEDPFEDSVLWSRAYLDFRAGHRAAAPRWVSNER
nr:WG repeat-containing protein [Bradyrhizobium acaciae]